MAKINGTSILVYRNGTVIAYQKGCSVTFEQDLPGATTKASAGWEEHINGTRRVTCDFDALFSTDGISDDDLIGNITGRTDLVLVIDGGGYPIVGKATVKNVSINASMEEPAGLNGSFKFIGPAYMLTGAFVQLNTSWTNGDYDTFTTSGTAVSSGINLAGGASALTNTFNFSNAGVYTIITYLTLTSGQAPNVGLYSAGGVLSSSEATLTAGVNMVTVTATSSETGGSLKLTNSAAGNWAVTSVYCFKSA